MAIDWTGGYSARWRVDRIDAATWEPCGTLGGVESIEIERDCTDDVPLLESATLTVVSGALEAFEPGWHRVTMEATQGTHTEAVDICTMRLDARSGTYDKGYREDAVEGRSVLYQAGEIPIGDGAYAPKGADGAAWAANALASCIDAPVSAAGSFELPDNIVFDLDSSVLGAAWAVVRSASWIIAVDGRGEVSVLPMPQSPDLSIGSTTAGMVMPKTAYADGAVSYTREYQPGIGLYSLVSGSLPARGLDGLYRIVGQKLTCSVGLTVEETAEVVR